MSRCSQERNELRAVVTYKRSLPFGCNGRLAPAGLTDGMKVMNGPEAEVRVGNCLPLANIPVGTQVHNIELHPGKGGQLVRSAGMSAQLMAKEYYVGDDGQLVRSEWVDYDGSYYFVNSSGAKITNDWRLTTPCDDDSADEEWYYFQSNGKMAANKKITYKGKTYYFDTDGKMLTGWVTTGEGKESVNEASTFEDGHTFYCDETGARVEGAWVKDTKPGTSDDDADEDEHWYYLKKTTGKPATGKQANVNGQIYIFNDQAEMLYGWVAKIASGSNATWEQLNEEDNERAMNANDIEVYYCGDEDDGHAKKNKWMKTWLPNDTNEEEDDKEWFWFDKEGKDSRC